MDVREIVNRSRVLELRILGKTRHKWAKLPSFRYVASEFSLTIVVKNSYGSQTYCGCRIRGGPPGPPGEDLDVRLYGGDVATVKPAGQEDLN